MDVVKVGVLTSPAAHAGGGGGRTWGEACSSWPPIFLAHCFWTHGRGPGALPLQLSRSWKLPGDPP